MNILFCFSLLPFPLTFLYADKEFANDSNKPLFFDTCRVKTNYTENGPT
jgi:hypothetical protein